METGREAGRKAYLDDKFDCVSGGRSISSLWLQFRTSITNEFVKGKMLIIHHRAELEHDILVPEIIFVAHL